MGRARAAATLRPPMPDPQPPEPTRQPPPAAFAPIVTDDAAMRRVFAHIAAVAASGQPLLITGETGTGKDLLARSTHAMSGRAGPFIVIDAGGLDRLAPPAEGEVDAISGRAAGGTLYLDEIGELSPSAQAALRRLLRPSEREDAAAARVVVSTSRDPRLLREGAGFRGDLFYRLRTHHVHLPPLRERRGDLALLLEHFADEAARTLRRPRPTVPGRLAQLLENHPFPGNVRELRALVLDAVAFPSTLPTLRGVQELLVDEALRRSRGNQAMAASWLGITRQGLNKRLRGRVPRAAPCPGAPTAGASAPPPVA